MKKSLIKWQIAGFIFTGIMGVLLHFLYDLTGQNVFVAPFSAVNESIWEHMKLLFYPMFVFAIIESRFTGKDYKNFWCVKLIGIVLGILTIPVIYYTYNGAFGSSRDWVNIAIFFIAAAIIYFIETKLLNRGKPSCNRPLAAFSVLCLIALIFIEFTFIPPHLPLFADPITKTFGI